MFSRAKLLKFGGLIVFGLFLSVARSPNQTFATPLGQNRIPEGGKPGTRQSYPQLGNESSGLLLSDETLQYYYMMNGIKMGAADLEKRLGERLPGTRHLLQQIQTNTVFLQQKWMTWSKTHPNRKLYGGNLQFDLYYQTLEANRKELQILLKASVEKKVAALKDLASEINARTEKRIVDGVKAVADDVHTKAENCRHSKDGLGKTVKVFVRTLDQTHTNEISGGEVYYASVARWILNGERPLSRPSRFQKLSSPAIENNFAPGNYMMWIKTRKGRSSEEYRRVGGYGELEFWLELHE